MALQKTRGSGGEQLRRAASRCVHGEFGRRGDLEIREARDRANPVFVDNGASDSEARYSSLGGGGANARNGFSEGRLAVEAAFAGNHQLGRCDMARERERLGDVAEAGFNASAREGDESSDEPAARARAWEVPDGDAAIALNNGGIVIQGPVEFEYGGGAGTLLRAVDDARALGSTERVADVRQRNDLNLAETGIESGIIEPGETGESGSSRGQRSAVVVKEACTERCGHSGAAVVSSAAADADEDAGDTSIERGTDELARSVGAGATRIAAIRRDEMETGGRSHLNDGGTATVDEGPTGRGGFAERAIGAREGVTAAQANGDGVDGAGTTIREGETIDMGRGKNLLGAGGEGANSLKRREAAFEFLRSEQDAHAASGFGARAMVFGKAAADQTKSKM